jgi:peptide-methionine (S)-S-oxide reductase
MFDKSDLVAPADALPGRVSAIAVSGHHFVLSSNYLPPYAQDLELAYFGLGCFWGAERLFWKQDGVVTTAVGYAGGYTPNPTYEEVCSGRTGHAEVVLALFDPATIRYEQLLRRFFESHDPTQGMRQGNDVGSQYRSMILTTSNDQMAQAKMAMDDYQHALSAAGKGAVTTELEPLQHFYFAEEYHQQYLGKNPNGYCGLGGCGIMMPV